MHDDGDEGAGSAVERLRPMDGASLSNDVLIGDDDDDDEHPRAPADVREDLGVRHRGMSPMYQKGQCNARSAAQCTHAGRALQPATSS